MQSTRRVRPSFLKRLAEDALGGSARFATAATAESTRRSVAAPLAATWRPERFAPPAATTWRGFRRTSSASYSVSSFSRRAHPFPVVFAARGGDVSDEVDEADDGRRAKARMSKLLERLEAEETPEDVGLKAREKAKAFLDGFFGGDMSGVSDDVKIMSRSGSPTSPESSSSDSDDAHDSEDSDDESLTDASHHHSLVLRELRGLRRGSRRVVLQKLLQGGILSADPHAAEELKNIERSFRPPPGFRMKVIHIARTSKGTRAGGFGRFQALVVVGNGEGVLGWGMGKAVEVASAVSKAQQSAYRNLYPVARHNAHTITEEVVGKFGKTKVVMYPKSSGRGIVANPMLAGVCQLAGIYDVGVKVHGSRNPQNTIKCLFAALDQLRSEDELRGWDEEKGVLRVPTLTGRFGRVDMTVN